MNISLYQAASALEGNLQRQHVIAENLASSSVPGFKRHNMTFNAVDATMFDDQLKAADQTQVRWMLPRFTVSTDFQQGTLMPTGDNTNVALDGPGFFSVTGQDGETLYTRDGSFRTNDLGQLIAKDGNLLQGVGGGPITVDTNSKHPVTIAKDGTVTQGGPSLGRLNVVSFATEDMPKLQRLNAGYFTSGGLTPLPADESETTVAMGFVEGANTTPSHEMGQLMTTLRHFEANQKIMKIQDQHMGKLIRELTDTK